MQAFFGFFLDKNGAQTVHGLSFIRELVFFVNAKNFSGFRKICHTLYKFDPRTENDFAVIFRAGPGSF